MPAVLGTPGTGSGGGSGPFTDLVVTNTLTLSAFTEGSVLFTGPGGLVSQDNPFFFYDNTNNVVCIGTNTSGLDVGSYAALKIVPGSGQIPLAISAFTDSSVMVFAQANGTEASPTVVTDDQTIGGFFTIGYDGAGYTASGAIASIAQSPISPGIVPSWLYFATGDTAGNSSVGMVIDENQDVYIYNELILASTTVNQILVTDASQRIKSQAFSSNGQLIIGKATGGYTVDTLTAGSNISITNGTGSITIAVDTTPAFTSLTISGSLTVSSLTADRVLITTTGGQITTTGFLKWVSANNQLNITGTGASISLGFVKVDIQDSFTYCTAANMGIYRPNGTSKEIKFYNGTSAVTANKRWAIFVDNTAESGSNAGSNFRFNAYADDGTFIDSPMQIYRAASVPMVFTRSVQFNGYGIWLVYARTPQIYGSVAAGGDLRINSTLDTTKGQVFICDQSNFDENTGFTKIGSTATPTKELDVAGEIMSSGDVYAGSETGSSQVMIRMNRYFGTEAASSGYANKISLFNSSLNPVYGFGVSSGSLDYVSASNHNFYSGTTSIVTIQSSGQLFQLNSGTTINQSNGTGVFASSSSSSLNGWSFTATNSTTSGTTRAVVAKARPNPGSASSANFYSIDLQPDMSVIAANVTGEIWNAVATSTTPPSGTTCTLVGGHKSVVGRVLTGTVTTMYGLWVTQGSASGGSVTTAYGLRVGALTLGGTNWQLAIEAGNSYFAGKIAVGSVSAPTNEISVTGTIDYSVNLVGPIHTGSTSSGGSLTLRSTSNASKGSVIFDETTDSTSSISGAVKLSGGMGIAKSLYIGTDLGAAGSISFSGTTDSSSTSTGILVVSGGVGIAKKLYVGSTTDATSTTAAGVVLSGGLAVAKQIWAGTRITSDGASGTNRGMNICTSGSVRWGVLAGSTAESGSNTGSPFVVNALDDSGTFIDSPISIVRASGGTLSLGRPVDISGAVTLTSTITKYGNVTTVGNGIASIVATSNLTAQGAAIAATTIYAVPASKGGLYRVSWTATITRAATTSCVLGGTNGFQLKFTDLNDSVVKTSNPTTTTYMTSATNATGTTVSGTLNAYCLASSNLQYLFDYTSVGATTMQYDLSIRVEYLG